MRVVAGQWPWKCRQCRDFCIDVNGMNCEDRDEMEAQDD